MPKKYSELRANERCIYQAFTKASTDTPENMGKAVNDAGYDADDEKAVIVLADKYGFEQCDMVLAADLSSGAANFHAKSEIIAIVTNDHSVSAKVPAVAANMNIHVSPRDILVNCAASVTWHAIYGRADKDMKVTWQDDQRIFPNGPVGRACAVYFSRAIKP